MTSEGTDKILKPESQPGDASDQAIRPQRLDDFTGQNHVKEVLQIAIESAKRRGEALDHVLLSGPPGLGKTTLAHIIALEMQSAISVSSGPVIERPGDLAAILTPLRHQDLLFIDEIHRIAPVVEETLYPAMEDYRIDVMIGEGASARSIQLHLERFTLVGATTRTGLLGSPFRDRFGILLRLHLYEPADLTTIILRSAAILQIPITPDGAAEIAKRSRGTPRIANRLLRRVRDYAFVKGDGTITASLADQALILLGVDQLGLDEIDRMVLQTIAYVFNGGPVGLKTLAISIGEDIKTIEDVHEPFLIQSGFIKRTPQGREVTPAGKKHIESSTMKRDIVYMQI
ncbi:MAG: Holliday junction branch migration DNA helicase RuvB [Euryarchaeota archaeon]|nr:Holliday junction branch migration DNA helicase RuvB [Euryarchaeota archaeon]